MEKHNGQYQPTCLLAHSLINKLSIIIGRCDLLRGKTAEDSEYYRRLVSIQELARSMADEITKHQCHFEAMAREADWKNPLLGNEPEVPAPREPAGDELLVIAKTRR